MRQLQLIAAMLLVTATLACAAAKDITSAEAKALLARNPQVFLLDVRTTEEYRQARIRGAYLVPIQDLERRLAEIPKNRPVLIYCAVGSRSNAAAGMLQRKGYREVFNMSDGIMGWYRNGFPVDR